MLYMSAGGGGRRFKRCPIVLVVLYAIFILVFRNKLVIIRVFGPKYVNVAHFVFSFCVFCVVCGCFGGIQWRIVVGIHCSLVFR
jgi:hypothetical protein